MDIEPTIEISVEDNAWKDFVDYMNNLGLGEIYDINNYTGIPSLRDRGVMMYYVFSSGKPDDQRMKDLLSELESIDDNDPEIRDKFDRAISDALGFNVRPESPTSEERCVRWTCHLSRIFKTLFGLCWKRA